MSEPVSIVIGARKNSQRCKNKMLRKFDDSNLLSICLNKFRGRKDVYLAALGDEFYSLSKKFDVNYIERTEESVNGEDIPTITKFFEEVPTNIVCSINACCPMLKSTTVDKAVELFQLSDIKSLVGVKKFHELLFDENGGVINVDVNCFNSKLRKNHFVANNTMIIVNKSFLFKNKTYWSYSENDPFLFEMDPIESIDIDTELDFIIAEAVYTYNA